MKKMNEAEKEFWNKLEQIKTKEYLYKDEINLDNIL